MAEITLLQRITDRLVLCPSTHPVDPENRERRMIPVRGGHVEAWVTRTVAANSSIASANRPDLIAIKFPGAGGRAERGGPHPCELWPDVSADIWTINNAGYGGSSGAATLQSFAETADAVWDDVQATHPNAPVLVVGNSLGCVSALYLSARCPVTWLYLRNPVPLIQLISTRPKYAWLSLGMSKAIAAQVPRELDAVANSEKSDCRALFVVSEKDRVIPVRYQQMIIHGYGGPHRIFTIRGADHHHHVPDEQAAEYTESVQWLHCGAIAE